MKKIILLALILMSCGSNPLEVKEEGIATLDTVVFSLISGKDWYYVYSERKENVRKTFYFVRGDFVDPKYKKGFRHSFQLTGLIDTSIVNREKRMFTPQKILTYNYKYSRVDTTDVMLMLYKY